MKSQVRNLIAVAIVLAFGLAGAQAQTLKANVPFAFQIGSKVMPAGEYTFDISDMHALSARDNSKDSAMAQTYVAGYQNSDKETGKLVFRSNGSAMCLAELWSPDQQEIRALHVAKSKIPTVAKLNGPEEVTIAAVLVH